MTAVNINVLFHVMVTEKNGKFGIWEIILLLIVCCIISCEPEVVNRRAAFRC